MKNHSELLQTLLEYLSFNYRQYLIYKFYRDNKVIFKPFYDSELVYSSTFLTGHLLGMAKLLDPEVDRNNNKNFSIYLFDDDGLLEDVEIEKIINKLFDLRRKWLAHIDYSYISDKTNIDKIKFNKGDEEKLFQLFRNISKKYALKYCPEFSIIDERFDDIEKRTQQALNKIHNSNKTSYVK